MIERIIEEAGRNRLLLKFTYRSAKKGLSERVVEPYEMKENALYGYCVHSNGIRKFKLDSIIQPQATSTTFVPRWDVKL